jgi:FAD/FMN-containing dehydrogenase
MLTKTSTKSTPTSDPALLARFAAIVGEKYAITDEDAQAPYLVEMRDMFRGHTPVVLRPGSVAEVSEILRLANETATAIVPQGGNTGLVGGQTPHAGELLLSLNRLDRVREVDPVSNTMTCEAGVTLLRAREAAAAADRLYPQLLPSEGTCTIGGNLSTNAGGTAALAYGIARSHALGLEVVLADGRVLHNLNKLKKDNTGYDLNNLFIGAEGTLGVITAAVLRLLPQPRSVETAFLGVGSPQAALDLLGLASERAAGGVTSFELMSQEGIELPRSAARCASLVRADRAFLPGALGPARGAGGAAGGGPRARTGRRRYHRRQPRSDQDVLAHPRAHGRGAAPGRRLHQA